VPIGPAGNGCLASINDVSAQSQHVPVRRRCVQMGAPIGSGRVLDLTESHGTDQQRSASRSSAVRWTLLG
jgi:hypothetical protein